MPQSVDEAETGVLVPTDPEFDEIVPDIMKKHPDNPTSANAIPATRNRDKMLMESSSECCDVNPLRRLQADAIGVRLVELNDSEEVPDAQFGRNIGYLTAWTCADQLAGRSVGNIARLDQMQVAHVAR
jgi:hypothetical protein